MGIKLKKWLSQIPEYIPGRTIEEIKKEYNLKDVYKLASNENLYGPDPKVLKEISSGLKDIKFYPDSACRQVKQKLGEKYGVSTDCIIMGNGTDQIIEMICDGFIGPGENAVIADPTFLIYEKSVLKSGGSVIKVPLKEFRQDVKMMVKSIDNGTRILFLTNPHNPTGSNISREEFEYIIKNTNGGILVVVDEAYSEYALESEKADTLRYLNKYKNLIVLRTFSKIYGLAGLRIGYGISDSSIISVLNKIRLPFNINSLAQRAAVAALENESYIKKVVKKVYKEKNRFYKVLLKNKIGFIKSYANFILINVGKNCDMIVEELLKKGFIVRPGKNLGLPDYIRVTVGKTETNIKFLNSLIEIINVSKCRK
jgi:histidinol-phosphate aminotransferase